MIDLVLAWLLSGQPTLTPAAASVYVTDGNLKPVPALIYWDCELAGSGLARSRTGHAQFVTVGIDRCKVGAVANGQVYRWELGAVRSGKAVHFAGGG